MREQPRWLAACFHVLDSGDYLIMLRDSPPGLSRFMAHRATGHGERGDQGNRTMAITAEFFCRQGKTQVYRVERNGKFIGEIEHDGRIYRAIGRGNLPLGDARTIAGAIDLYTGLSAVKSAKTPASLPQ
jgi:hypothetical protein